MIQEVDIDIAQLKLMLEMLADHQYWPGGVPPRSIKMLIQWAIDDYLDAYLSERGR